MNELAMFAAVAVAAGGAYVLYQSMNGGAPEGNNASAPAAPNLESKIQQFMQAIAHAEGFGAPGAVPTRANNPGDLGPGDCGAQYPLINAVGSQVSQLPNVQLGWDLLHAKIQRAFTGQSSTYSPNMTVEQFAQKYAGDWQNWATNVSAYLGITPQTRIADWLAM